MAEAKTASRIHENSTGLSEAAHGVMDAATDMAAQARDRVVEMGQAGYKKAVKKSKEYRTSIETYIEDNPWQAMGIAIGAGLLLGLYLKRSRD